VIVVALAAGVIVVASLVVVVIGRARRRDRDLGTVPLTAERRGYLNDMQHRQHQDRGD